MSTVVPNMRTVTTLEDRTPANVNAVTTATVGLAEVRTAVTSRFKQINESVKVLSKDHLIL